MGVRGGGGRRKRNGSRVAGASAPASQVRRVKLVGRGGVHRLCKTPAGASSMRSNTAAAAAAALTELWRSHCVGGCHRVFIAYSDLVRGQWKRHGATLREGRQRAAAPAAAPPPRTANGGWSGFYGLCYINHSGLFLSFHHRHQPPSRALTRRRRGTLRPQRRSALQPSALASPRCLNLEN